MKHDLRPYLIVPKLIEQPTWGGSYIVKTKDWQNHLDLKGKKIGQSYELFDKSNLSDLKSSNDPGFFGELTDRKSVEKQTQPAGTFSLSELIYQNPSAVLGGNEMNLLIKFTQAQGNSFQLHLKDGMDDPVWKSKPESWYFFEPGFITCGVKEGVDWDAYRNAVVATQKRMEEISADVREKNIEYEDAKLLIAEALDTYDPWQYVNNVYVEKDTLIDLSPCGIHHSWEEDVKSVPLGNVVYEVQLNLLDDVSTIRSFDKGKMSRDGAIRPIQIDDYFRLIDRTPSANDPQTHMRKAEVIEELPEHTKSMLLKTKYYSVDKILLHNEGRYAEQIKTFRHLFVKSGAVDIHAMHETVYVSQGHSAFIPAGVGEYELQDTGSGSEVLVTY